MEEIRAWTSGYCYRPDYCGWAYLIRYETEEGPFDVRDVDYSKGTTAHQMALMAILQAIKKINDLPDKTDCKILIYSNNKRAVKCINGVYNCNARVVADYLDEIDWARGQLRIEFLLMSDWPFMKENNIVNKMAMNIK